jgi:tRNA(Ile)-lysidine synthase
MLSPGDAVLAGVSGGPDSVALIHILNRLAGEFRISIGVAHLDHGLRGEASRRDARYVAELAEGLGIPCFSARRDVAGYQRTQRLSLEEAARQVRYEFFETTADRRGFDKIALGHHADDNAELVLMHLLRGSGPLGISGIPPVRDCRFVRPLIDLERRQIIDYLSEIGADYVTDASNADMRYERNRIRGHLIPLLREKYNPDVSRTLNRLAEILRAEEAWLAPIVTDLLERCCIAEGPDRITLSLPALRELAPAARRRVLRAAVKRVKGDLRRIGLAHIDRLCREIPGGACRGNRTLHLPDRIQAMRTRSEIVIVQAARPLRAERLPPDTPAFEYRVDGPMELWIQPIGRRLRFSVMPAGDADHWKDAPPDMAFMDVAALRFPLRVRNVLPGDRFTPLGLQGTQKLKSFFINNKVPAAERRRCPLVLSGDAIVWVAGHRIADPVKVTGTSKNLLKVELLLA